jgi:alpha-tubulin suppressor-like RCC1 family protein
MKIRIIPLLILMVILFILVPCVAQAKITAISRGLQTVLALDDQGHVWMWGDGTPPSNAQKLSIDNVTAIAADGSNYALKNDGTVWAWGFGGYGMLGNGETVTYNTPVQVSDLTDVIEISAGPQNGYALKKDGTVWAWGLNNKGQLGIGTYGTPALVSTPVQVLGLTDIVALGSNGGYAIKKDGTLYTWLNDTLAYPGGQPIPFKVPYADNVKQTTYVSDKNTNFLKNDGTVWGWGDNQYGEMGNGTRTSLALGEVNVWPPVQATITDVKQIAIWLFIVDALKNDGTVWEWGNSQLERPRSTNLGLLSPMQVSGLDHVVQIGTGIALKDDGTVWGWGQNFGKWLKDASDNTVVTSPIMIFKEPEQAPTPTPTPTITPTPTVTPSNTSSPSENPTVTPVTTPAPSTTEQPTSTVSPIDSGLILTVVGIAGLVLAAGIVVYMWMTKRL